MLRRYALALVLPGLAGCSQLLGLEAPQRRGDGGTDDGRIADGRPGDGAMADVAITSGACPSTYAPVTFGGTYRFVMQQGPWDAAMMDCVNDALPNSSKRTHLIVLASDMELTAAESLAQGAAFWTGLTDRVTEASYLWVTNESLAYPPSSGPPWAQNQPSMSAAEDCVNVDAFGQLGVVACGTARRYICECDDFAPDTARY